MKIAVLSRHRRLLALCGVSAALHLLVLQLLARHGGPESMPAPDGPGPLVLRLAPATSPLTAAPAAQAAHAAAPTPAAPPAARTRPAAQASAPARPASSTPPPVRADDTATSQAAAASGASPQPVPAPVPAAGTGAGGAPSGDALPVQMPARYRVRMPPSVRLAYTLTRRDATGKAGPAQAALLDWRNDDGRYSLRMDGVFGQVSSSGADSDSGILPQRYTARDGNRETSIAFDPARQRVVFGDGSEAPGAPGLQDRASLLMQLAGIGLARPGQLQDVLEIVVAGADVARIERFQVMGEEQLSTGAGTVKTLRLAQRVAAGEPRLEVWLAPDQGWLPVQLRVTQADGSSATQVLARAPAPEP